MQREVAGGGMGIVFEGRHQKLNLRVAIKILRPELATATNVERFLGEGRILARLTHPNIVRIFDAGEKAGLNFYAMEFVEGETLADRLRRGPLDPEESLRMGEELLHALGAVHALGVVHRDVKPANIFLRKGRTLLGDFGIAHSEQEHEADLTTPGQAIGTVRYMSPEHRDGVEVTQRADVYSAGLVLWEACTGARWPVYQSPEAADWRRVPPPLAPVMRRALALDASERWRDAREALGALTRPPVRHRWPWVVGSTGLAAGLALFLWGSRGPASTELLLEITSLETVPELAAFGDAVVQELVSSLRGYVDLTVRDARGRSPTTGAVRLTGSAVYTGDTLKLELGPSGSGRGAVRAHAAGPGPAWKSMVQGLADSMVGLVWRGRVEGERFLPIHALPKSGLALSLWHRAERMYAQGAWDTAQAVYAAAELADLSCLICSYRLLDIERWQSGGQDSARLARVGAGIDSFPDHYRALIAAQREPWPARYEHLMAAAKAWPDFFLASFLLGDEIFHRGPLWGVRRRDALEPMRRAVALRPDFAPGWEHLAWLLLSERDSATREAIDSVAPARAGAGLSLVLRLMLQLGFQWRFGTPETAAAASGTVHSMPPIESDFRAPAGGRMMMTVDAPAGAVGLGRVLEQRRELPGALRSGLIAQAHGWAALGRPDSLRAVAIRFRRESYPGLALYALMLEGALSVFDPGEPLSPDSSLMLDLGRYLERGAASPEVQRQASWMLALLALRQGDRMSAARFREGLADEPAPAWLRTEVDAFDALTQGDTARARVMLDALTPPETVWARPEPLLDAVSRLLRATYAERVSGWRIAADQLRWHEHLQLTGFPTEDPQQGEAAWALSTLVRWRRGELLKRMGQPDAELCAVQASVARLWKAGTPRFAARADSARRLYTVHRCAELL